MYYRSAIYSDGNDQPCGQHKLPEHGIMQHDSLQLQPNRDYTGRDKVCVELTNIVRRPVRRVIGHRSEHTERQPDQYSSLSRDSDI